MSLDLEPAQEPSSESEKETIKMSIYKLAGSLSLSAIGFLALPLLASARPKATNTETEKKALELFEPASVDGKTLTPGRYEVLIEGKQVSFERNGEAVVTASCDWKTMDHKAPYDSTTFSKNHSIQELQFHGRDQALEVE
jgi:hypothetical protein